jgi:sorting nexin-29
VFFNLQFRFAIHFQVVVLQVVSPCSDVVGHQRFVRPCCPHLEDDDVRGTTDQILVMRQNKEKCFEYGVDLYKLFIEFRQAFDSINRKAMLTALKKFKISQKLIRLVEVTLKDSRAKVLRAGRTSRNFEITSGVRQGDSLSAVLFNLALHKAVKELNLRGTIIYKTKQTCAYADDTALVARNMDSLKETFNILEEKNRIVVLRINEQKQNI